MREGALWSIRVPVAADVPGGVAAVEAALEPFSIALSTFEVGAAVWQVEALAAKRPDAGRLAAALFGLPAPAVARVPARDWVALSRRGLKSVRAGRFFVHGSHIAKWPRGTIPICVDPGVAFGTGHHATTRGCLLEIDRLTRRFARPLDLGCGSGILAIAMAKRWRVPVLAADNDPQAVAVARDNARSNGVGTLVRALKSSGYAAPAIGRKAPFDLVSANILARPLCRLAGGLARHLAPRGLAILAGLLADQEDMVLAAHRRQGLELVRRRRLDGWSILVLGR